MRKVFEETLVLAAGGAMLALAYGIVDLIARVIPLMQGCLP